jgi:hypothetical protein
MLKLAIAIRALTPLFAVLFGVILMWWAHVSGKMMVRFGPLLKRQEQPQLFRTYMIMRAVLLGVLLALGLFQAFLWGRSISN